MPTAKKRINVTVDDRTYDALRKLSGRREQPISAVSLELIQEALERQEDIYFSKVADERLGKKQRRVSHEDAWG